MKYNAKRVLVVDDETMIRQNVSELLRMRGYLVSEGRDGDDAASMAVAENPDVIVMDVMMPRKSGFDALTELRENPTTNHIPVLFLSAANDYELGANHDCESIATLTGVRAPEAFLEKPFDSNRLFAEISRALCA